MVGELSVSEDWPTCMSVSSPLFSTRYFTLEGMYVCLYVYVGVLSIPSPLSLSFSLSLCLLSSPFLPPPFLHLIKGKVLIICHSRTAILKREVCLKVCWGVSVPLLDVLQGFCVLNLFVFTVFVLISREETDGEEHKGI